MLYIKFYCCYYIAIIPITRKYKDSLNTTLNLYKTTLIPLSNTIKQITKPHILNNDELLVSVRHQTKINFLKFNKIKQEYIEEDNISEYDVKPSKNKKSRPLNPEFKYHKINELNLENNNYFRHIAQNSYLPNEFLVLDNNNSIKLYNLELNE